MYIRLPNLHEHEWLWQNALCNYVKSCALQVPAIKSIAFLNNYFKVLQSDALSGDIHFFSGFTMLEFINQCKIKLFLSNNIYRFLALFIKPGKILQIQRSVRSRVLYKQCQEFLLFDTLEHVFYRTFRCPILVSILYYDFIWFFLCSLRFDWHD